MRIESRRPWLPSHLGLTPARKFFKDLIINAAHKNIDKEGHEVLVYDNNIISKVLFTHTIIKLLFYGGTAQYSHICEGFRDYR